ncbi:MAG: uridine kinase [Chloroflexi bacterium]|nr:uridine kinase [Chloroflexota bacterium]
MSSQSKPLVVGIAGGSASGKTTIAARLTDDLRGLTVETVHMDAYFWPAKPRTAAPISGVVYDDYNLPQSFDLARLVVDLDERCSCPDAPQVVIIEGLMTLHDAALRARLDLGIFVDAQSDERIVRRLKRNMARGMSFDDIATYFLDSVRYRHQEYVEPSRWHADVVLNGSNTSPRGVALVADWIRRHAPAPGNGR